MEINNRTCSSNGRALQVIAQTVCSIPRLRSEQARTCTSLAPHTLRQLALLLLPAEPPR